MISYNTSKILVSQGSDNSVVNLKSKASQGASDTDFKSVFDKTLSNTSKRTANNAASNNDRQLSDNTEAKPKYNSYRDIQAERPSASNQSNVKKTSGSLKTEDVNAVSEDLSEDTAYDEQINIIAQMLGISPNELIKLAKDLGFSAEDLKDVKKLALFMQKLGNLLELDDSQKETLVKIAQEVAKQTTSVDEGSDTKTNETAVKADNTANNTEIDAEKLSKLSTDLKARLDSLIQAEKTDTASLSSEISKIIAAMKAQAQNRISVAAGTAGDQQVSQLTEISSEEFNVNPEIKEDKAKAEKSEKNVDAKASDSEKVVPQTEVKSPAVQVNVGNNQEQQIQVLGDVKVTTINNQVTETKSAFTMPQPVRNSEIIDQVVQQAKVIMGQDKSEMVIQLKPDHLGKLELKVVTEQGIVAAKFIAESQQVKEIIETNMQLLKDSLQKQGISIDGVSVQVGHDRRSEYQQQNSYDSKSSTANRNRYGNDGSSGVSGVSGNILETLPERLAQYSDETSTINLTA
jgi:flagellar hook-length control protein FliK